MGFYFLLDAGRKPAEKFSRSCEDRIIQSDQNMIQATPLLPELAASTARFMIFLISLHSLSAATTAPNKIEAGTQPQVPSSLDWAGENWSFHTGSWDAEGHSPADASLAWSLVEEGGEKDAILACSGQPNGFLITRKEYTNYQLSLQWRWVGEEGGNSGLLISAVPSQPGFRLWPLSLEVQLAHGKAGDFYFLGGNMGGMLEGNIVQVHGGIPVVHARRFQLESDGAENIEKPLGEWNHIRLVVKGRVVEVFVNSRKVNHLEKLKPAQGKIALQSEGAPIEFRALQIEETD